MAKSQVSGSTGILCSRVSGAHSGDLEDGCCDIGLGWGLGHDNWFEGNLFYFVGHI